MGKHKRKSKDKKSLKSKRKHKRVSSSSEGSSSSSEEWVEKPQSSERQEEKDKSSKETYERESWMSLPSSFLLHSNLEKQREREKQRQQKRDKETYNPQESSRELNPYWKHGGDGLPKFKKPNDSDEAEISYSKKSFEKKLNWKKSATSSKQDEFESNRPSTSTSKSTDTTEDLNKLAAKLVKAELMGNTQLVAELKERLEKARSSQNNPSEHVILTKTDNLGRTQPVKLRSDEQNEYPSRKKKQKIETHEGGQRIRYFADDDKHSLQDMFESEKYATSKDVNQQFMKKIRKNDDLDDIFVDDIRTKIDSNNRDRDRAINEYKKLERSLENCFRCIQSDTMPKHLMISMGEATFISLPPHTPLTKGHCLISPIRHVGCSTLLDENEWTELTTMRKSLVKMFEKNGDDVIFFEHAIKLNYSPHMVLECIPIPNEKGFSAPIYFKKAIEECEEEWSQNKKLVSLKDRNVRKAIPKGLPYFFVSFGMTEGFAHVIEDERMFPGNFAQEIIGGMLDLHHSKWRKPKRESFEEQSRRVAEFMKDWNEEEN